MTFQNPVEKINEMLDAMKPNGTMPEFECFDVGIVRSVNLYVDTGMCSSPHYNFVMGVASGNALRSRSPPPSCSNTASRTLRGKSQRSAAPKSGAFIVGPQSSVAVFGRESRTRSTFPTERRPEAMATSSMPSLSTHVMRDGLSHHPKRLARF